MIATEKRFRAAAVPELMRSEGLSPSELAGRLGLTRQAIWSYGAGVTTPQFATILRMAELFGRPLDFFVDDGAEAEANLEKGG